MRKLMRGIGIPFLILVFFICGCGYTTQSLLPTNYKTIYIGNFTNKINVTAEQSDQRMYRGYRPGMEVDITTAVINKYISDGNLKVGRPETADIILKGELIDYKRDALRYDANNNVEEYRIKLVTNIELKDVKADKTVWTEKAFTGETTYRTGGSLAMSETSAVNDAVTDLARRIVERTVEAW